MVKYGMSGGKAMFDILPIESLTEDDIVSQPAQMIIYFSLLYDDELEQQYVNNAKGGGKAGDLKYAMDGKEIQEILFRNKYPELADSVVTLLPEKEYRELGFKA